MVAEIFHGKSFISIAAPMRARLIQVLDRMRKIIARLVFGFLAASVVFVASCSWQASSRTRSIDQIAIGDSEASVLERLGQPRVRESAGRPYQLYASQGCISPCATRLWWEWPLFRGIEAWSVELDSSNKVVSTAHWVSP
jgi:hypothetical protein